MICENPFTETGVARAYGCGSCVACRIKRKMEWTTRLELEASCHENSSFHTLTYAHAPQMQGPLLPGQVRPGPTLIRKDLSNWLKTLREAYHRKNSNSSPLRFFGCGEYGDKHERPHYHVILFGYKGCAYGRSRYDDGCTIDCCASCDLIRDTWRKGIVQCEPLARAHIRYTAGYVMKKMTSRHDTRLKGRAPEFSAMSLQNGGIGAPAVPKLVDRHHKARHNYDVLDNIIVDGKRMRIGRHLKKKMRLALGSPDGKAPDYVQKDAEAQMLPLLKAARLDKEAPTLKKQIIKQSQGKLASLKWRQDNFNGRKKNETL